MTIRIQPENRKYWWGALFGVALWVAIANQTSNRSISNSSIEKAISHSFDLSRYHDIFFKATKSMVENGTCSLESIESNGGWVKSHNHPNRNWYFTYCGESSNIYLDADTGDIFFMNE